MNQIGEFDEGSKPHSADSKRNWRCSIQIAAYNAGKAYTPHREAYEPIPQHWLDLIAVIESGDSPLNQWYSAGIVYAKC